MNDEASLAEASPLKNESNYTNTIELLHKFFSFEITAQHLFKISLIQFPLRYQYEFYFRRFLI